MNCPTKHLCHIVPKDREGLTPVRPTYNPAEPATAPIAAIVPALAPTPPPVIAALSLPAPVAAPIAVALPAAPKSDGEDEAFALDNFVAPPPAVTAPAPPANASPAPAPVASPAPAVKPFVFVSPAILTIGATVIPLYHGSILGREGDAGRELFRADKTVSRLHARLDVTAAGEVTLRNLAPTGNPVVIDGYSLAYNHTVTLTPGPHQVQLGTRFLCSITVAPAKSS